MHATNNHTDYLKLPREQIQKDNGTIWTVQARMMGNHLIRCLNDDVGVSVELVTRANVSTPYFVYAYFVLNGDSNLNHKFCLPFSLDF